MKLIKTIPLLFLIMAFSMVNDYPIDGYETTGIRRLQRLELIMSGEIQDTKPITGSQKSINDIKLNLTGSKGDSLKEFPMPDPGLQKAINSIFPGLDNSYSLALLDITPNKPIRFSQRQPQRGYQPGSVGKLAVVTGFFEQLSIIYPHKFEERIKLMRNKSVRAGKWALTDSHTVPIFDTETKKLTKRVVLENDVFSLYEWVDHMLSVSNNGAASVVWREVLLMKVFGKAYPALTEEEANNYFKNTPKQELADVANAVVNEPLRELGITTDEWRLGSFFTRGASSIVPDKGGSIGTVSGLMKFLIALEQGKIIDRNSSLEIKRLIYMTDRRIRYAGATVLKDAAVYFKSGSLYQCQPEEGFDCQKYMANKSNFMNSIAIVEHPDGTTYMVCLMSNVLKKNSSNDHFALATSIDRLIRK